MSMDLRIEYGAAEAEDLAAVVALCMEVEAQHERYWPLRWQRREGLEEGYLSWMRGRLKDPRMLIYVARDRSLPGPATLFDPEGKTRGAVVGMVIVTIMKEVPIYTYSEYAFIQDMAVREGHRRRGIAQRLLAGAAEWTEGRGLNQLRLMVADQNPGGRAAFEKAGFRPTYQEMVLPVGEGKHETRNAKRET
jgi:GNAT superfamily N-acetyltransferase